MTKRIKVLVFTGAGVSAESGIETFRTGDDGLWLNHKIEDVATPQGWKRNPKLVLDFYNDRRRQLKRVQPNLAHKIIADLEKDFDVTVVTQNVDNLHERAGSKNVLHLHGELTQVRSTSNSSLIYDRDDDVNIGDLCVMGSQLRPNIVWFGEILNPDIMEKVSDVAKEADVCIVVGTSMQVSPANSIPFLTKETALIYYVDPTEVDFKISYYRKSFFYQIKEVATTGVKKVYDDLIKIYKNEES